MACASWRADSKVCRRDFAGSGGSCRGFVDDSLATNVLPTREALEAFATRRVALIAGGHDRGIDYTPLADYLATRVAPTAVVSLPESGPRITEVVRARTAVPTVDVDDIETAVARAFELAQPDGVVLLSPAAPSFGQFRNYAERSERFAKEFRRLLH
jgi:UDP-N-acetylmuramoyl-L-alanine---L-glutamate ligase